MTDPHEVFQQIFHLLKDGGVCEIAIPVVPNLAFELFRENWYQLDAPRHIFLHSQKSIAYLAEEANLKLLKTEYVSNNNQFLHSMLYKEGIPFEQHTPRLYEQCFNKMDIELCTALAKKVNEEQYGDMAVFSFRKKTKAEMLQEEKEKQEEVGKEKLLLLMEEAVLYLIQQREAKQLEKAAFLVKSDIRNPLCYLLITS